MRRLGLARFSSCDWRRFQLQVGAPGGLGSLSLGDSDVEAGVGATLTPPAVTARSRRCRVSTGMPGTRIPSTRLRASLPA